MANVSDQPQASERIQNMVAAIQLYRHRAKSKDGAPELIQVMPLLSPPSCSPQDFPFLLSDRNRSIKVTLRLSKTDLMLGTFDGAVRQLLERAIEFLEDSEAQDQRHEAP